MAVLLGMTALVTALAPRPTVTPPRANSTPSPQAPETTAPPAAPAATRVIEQTIDASAGARQVRVRARVGDIVRLVVRGDVLDAVEIEGLGKIEPLEPGSPARFEILAEAPDEHPIVLLDADRPVGRLEFRAAG